MEVITIREVEDPEISVIIPTLNEEKYIERCLFSLRDQDFDGSYEIIVGDSGSKDKTVEIAKRYADKIVITGRIGSPAFNRNPGARISKGRILAFLDADSIVTRNFLKEVKKAFEDPEVIAATGPIYPDNPKYIHMYWMTNKVNELLIKFKKGWLFGSFTVVRRDVFFELGGFPENVYPGEDIEFSYKIRDHEGKIAWLENTMVITSSRRLEKMGGAVRFLIDFYSNYFKAKRRKVVIREWAFKNR